MPTRINIPEEFRQPARIETPGTFQFPHDVGAVYTIGHDHVALGMSHMLDTLDSPGNLHLAVDIETYGLGHLARYLKSVTISTSRHAVVFDPRDPYQHEMLRGFFESDIRWVFHNSVYDVPNMYLYGLVDFAFVENVTDTLIYARLANPDEISPKRLDAAAQRYLGVKSGGALERAFRAHRMSKSEGWHRFDLDRPLYALGAASDGILTSRLLPIVRQDAFDRTTKRHPFTSWGVTGDEAWELVEREQELNRMMLWRSCRGIRVDKDFLERYQEENAREIRMAELRLEEAGIRPGNSADLGRKLEDDGKLPPGFPRTKKTDKPSMTAKNVELLRDPLAQMFVRHKQLVKVGKDYLDKTWTLADDNGRVHPQVNFLAATTGRMSYSEPAFQQFNKPARGVVLFDEGDDGTSIDLSQIEPVFMANAAGDMRVIEGYENGTSDLYTGLGVATGMLPKGTVTADTEGKDDVSQELKRRRGIMKTTLLAQLYGEGPAKLTADLNLDPGPYELPTEWEVEVRGFDPDVPIPRYAEAKRYRELVFQAMPKSAVLIDKLKTIGAQHRLIFTVSGRILTVPSVYGRVQTHKAVNYFCQGGAYDLLADAMLRIYRAGLGQYVYLAIHDELVVSTSAAPEIRRILETPAERFVKLSRRTPVLRTDMVRLGERWSDA